MTLLSITGNSSRQFSPLKEDEAAMRGALDVVAMIAPTDAVMETDMQWRRCIIQQWNAYSNRFEYKETTTS